MKWIIPITLAVALASCGQKAAEQQNELSEKHQALVTAHIDLRESYDAQQTWIKRFNEQLTEINATSDLIDQPLELPAGVKGAERRLIALSSVMDLNHFELSKLRDSLQLERQKGLQLRGDLAKAAKLESTYLFALEDAERTIDRMVASLDEEIEWADQLLIQLEKSEQVRALQEQALHQVKLAYGTRRELKDHGLAERKGGIAGIGGALVSAVGDKELYTTLDRRLTTSIPFPAEKCKLISTHPTNSYEWMNENGQSILVITQPDAFWANSSTLTTVLL